MITRSWNGVRGILADDKAAIIAAIEYTPGYPGQGYDDYCEQAMLATERAYRLIRADGLIPVLPNGYWLPEDGGQGAAYPAIA